MKPKTLHVFSFKSSLLAKIRVHKPEYSFSSEKVISSKSGENYAQIKQRFQANTVQNRFWCQTIGDDFFTGWSVVMDYVQKRCFKERKINDGFVFTNTQLFTSRDVNWWTGVVWIIVMFLSVWTLILTAPIHCRGSLVNTWCHFSKSVPIKKQTYLHIWSEGDFFQQMFGWTIYLSNILC